MKTTLLFPLALVGLWVQIITGAAIPPGKNESIHEDHLSLESLVPRTDPANTLKPWNVGETKPGTFWGFRPDKRTEVSDSEIIAYVKSGYESSKALHTEMEVSYDGADLVSTLFVPGNGWYTASSPKGGVKSLLKIDEKRKVPVAPVLNKNRGRAVRRCAEDAVFYQFEQDNRKLLDPNAERPYPVGTKVSTYGRMKTPPENSKNNKGNEAGEGSATGKGKEAAGKGNAAGKGKEAAGEGNTSTSGKGKDGAGEGNVAGKGSATGNQEDDSYEALFAKPCENCQITLTNLKIDFVVEPGKVHGECQSGD